MCHVKYETDKNASDACSETMLLFRDGQNVLEESMEVDESSRKYSPDADIKFQKRKKVNVKLVLRNKSWIGTWQLLTIAGNIELCLTLESDYLK